MNPARDMDDQVERWLAKEIPPDLFLTPLPDDVAKDIVERLKQEADRHWLIDPNHSLEFANRIIAIGKQQKNSSHIALGKMARGDALKILGNMQEAWDMLEQAGSLFESAGDEVGWARTRIGRLYLSPQLNCVSTALADAERARSIFLRYGDQDKLLRLDWNAGLVYNYLGEQHRALDLFNSAIVTAELLGQHGQRYIGPLNENIGLTYSALGNFHMALIHYEKARDLAITLNETVSIAQIETGIAEIYRVQGRYRSALTLLNSALERIAEESPFEVAMAKYHMVECYLSLNRYPEARLLAVQVIEDCRNFNAAYELARTLMFLATIEATGGNFAAADTALTEAERIFTSRGAMSWIAMIHLWRGHLALKQDNPAIAYQEAIAAHSAFESNGQQVNDATATLLQGQALFALGEFVSAGTAAKKTLNIAQHYNIPSLRYAAHLLLGQIAEVKTKYHLATHRYRAAAATIERLQRGLTITLRPGFLEDKGEALRRLIALQFRMNNPISAFETLERAKSQLWLDYLVNRERLRWSQDDSQSRVLIEELERLRSEHQSFYQLAHDPGSNDHGKAVNLEQAAAELAIRERRMRAITEQLYLRIDDRKKMDHIPVLSLQEIQQALAEDTVLIEYYNDGEHLWAFTLERHDLNVHRLSLTHQTLNQLIQQLQGNILAALKINPGAAGALSLTHLARRVLQQLYSLLIKPLGIGDNHKRLVIVPYGALHFLPFHLLYDGTNYLIERYEVVTLPSAGLVTRQSPRRASGALALAHSWDGRLPYTKKEAQIVQKMFRGQIFSEDEANRVALKGEPTQILHIATHSSHRLDQPDLSFLQFADGQLYGDDVMQHDLSYELVTLSACETGRVNVIAASDELIGIGRSFLYAGAGALVVSLWRVADISTVSLMERMYTCLQAGESKAAALRKAQKSILAENKDLHPAFWGAFQLVGNAAPLSK